MAKKDFIRTKESISRIVEADLKISNSLVLPAADATDEPVENAFAVQDGKLVLHNGTEWEAAGGGGSLDEDIKLDVALGALNAGDTLKAGTLTEVFEQLVNKTIYPNITASSWSIAQNAGTYQEIGRIIPSLGLSISFIRGTYVATWPGGTNYSYLGGGTTFRFYVGNATDPVQTGPGNTCTISNYEVKEGVNAFYGQFDYAQGPQAYDNKGKPYLQPQPAGSTPKFQTSSNLNGIAPWFFGTSSVNTGIDVYATGTKNVAPGSGTLTFNFGASASKYLWFAHDSGLPDKTDWKVDDINKGKIGGSDNLFASPVTMTVTCPASALNKGWSKSYKLYVSNYATTMNNIIIS